MKEKIQKILSNLGCDSRRNIEKYISLGIVFVNNKRVLRGERFDFLKIKKIFIKKKKFF